MTKKIVSRSVEMGDERFEGEDVIKVTYFEGGLDVAMYRFHDLDTALNSIRQFYQSGEPLTVHANRRSGAFMRKVSI